MSEFFAEEITGKDFEKLNKEDIMESNFAFYILFNTFDIPI